MKSIFICAFAVASMLVGTVAYAQVTTTANPPITVNSSPMTAPVAPGTSGAHMGTFSLSGGPSGTSNIISIPLTLAVSGGGSPNDLSNCQIYSPTGVALTSSLSSLQTGSNTFQFNPALSFTGSSATTYTTRCNISNSAASSSIYAFTAGQPIITINTGQPGSTGLMIGYVAAPTVTVGTRNVIGVITLNASRSNNSVRVASLPITAAFSGGASGTHLTNCTLAQLSAITTPLNTGANAVATLGNQSTFTLDTPMTITAGATQTVPLFCDVSAGTPIGGTVQISLTPSSVVATDAGTNAAITPTGIINSNGTVSTPSGTSVAALTPTTPPTTPSPTPGVPNTGAGNSMTLVLGLIVLITGAGALYLSSQKTSVA